MEMPCGLNLLHSIINASEKASNIARICRSDKNLLALLVQEKTGAEANARFLQDFKTLADVLIQETIKNDIGELFPAMREAIRGEESPSFTNQAGQTVAIEIGKTEEETSACLCAIMQDEKNAESLAAEVHKNVQYAGSELGDIPADLPGGLDYENLGVWIDPIDATAEYIAGGSKFTNIPEIAEAGLDCVTVLIGVYQLDCGRPIIGVISQPFFKNKNNEGLYQSHIIWGIALPELNANNCGSFAAANRKNHVAICSCSEKTTLLKTLEKANFDIVFSAGAGHKALKVLTNDADLYILSKGSTFKWDTCAPQAILRSLGGDMFDFVESVKQQRPINLKYSDKVRDETGDSKCNQGGVIAVRDLDLLQNLLPKLLS